MSDSEVCLISIIGKQLNEHQDNRLQVMPVKAMYIQSPNLKNRVISPPLLPDIQPRSAQSAKKIIVEFNIFSWTFLR